MRTPRGLHAGLEAPSSASPHCSGNPVFEQSLRPGGRPLAQAHVPWS